MMLQVTFYTAQDSPAFQVNLTKAVKTCIRKSTHIPGDAYYTVILNEEDLDAFFNYQLANLESYVDKFFKKGIISEEELSDFFSPYIKMINNLLVMQINYNLDKGNKDFSNLHRLNNVLHEFYVWVFSMNSGFGAKSQFIRYTLSHEDEITHHIKPYECESLPEATDEID